MITHPIITAITDTHHIELVGVKNVDRVVVGCKPGIPAVPLPLQEGAHMCVLVHASECWCTACAVGRYCILLRGHRQTQFLMCQTQTPATLLSISLYTRPPHTSPQSHLLYWQQDPLGLQRKHRTGVQEGRGVSMSCKEGWFPGKTIAVLLTQPIKKDRGDVRPQTPSPSQAILTCGAASSQP